MCVLLGSVHVSDGFPKNVDVVGGLVKLAPSSFFYYYYPHM